MTVFRDKHPTIYKITGFALGIKVIFGNYGSNGTLFYWCAGLYRQETNLLNLKFIFLQTRKPNLNFYLKLPQITHMRKRILYTYEH